MMFYDNGNISETGTWSNNKWRGPYILYYECSNNIEHKFIFNHLGKRVGAQEYYYANGQRYLEGNFKNGKEDGEFVFYNFKGRIVGKKIFEDGVETNESTVNSNVNLNTLKSQNDSIIKSYGTKKTEDASISGYKILYNSNKEISKKGTFVDSKLIDGKAYYYNDNGLLIRISVYKDGNYMEDEFNANLTEEEKDQKDLIEKLKNMDTELLSMKEIVSSKQKEVEQKDNQLKEQTLQNQVLAKEKVIKELLLFQQNNTMKIQEAESMKRQMQIATLNKDRRIKEIEIKSQKTENEKKEQELKRNAEQKKFQQVEINQQKFMKNLIIMGLVIVFGFLIFVFISLQKNKKANKIISLQKEEVEKQKHLVEEKHNEIRDSINYAERIQRSLLANNDLLNKNFKEHFVFFQPKDIVSGDFYWATQLSNQQFALVTADSTGHGVPGAIMSILNTACLNEAIKEGYCLPNEILNHTRTKIIEVLKRDGSKDGGKDGMDCSLISFDLKNNKFTYAAANNPIWIVRGKQLLEFAPDKMPVGKHDRDMISFTQHTVDLQKGDVVYALTDGLPDQFGGPKGKKFMYKQLKELLISIAHLPMQEQKKTLITSLNNWKGDLEQVDDVTLIGVRV